MTYGWMLLAVALVSGSLMGSSITSSCSGEVRGFDIHQLKVEETGFNSGNLKLRVLNDDSEEYDHKINKITVENPSNDENQTIYPSETVESGRANVYSLEGFSDSETCRTIEISLTYNRGSVLENQTATGTLTSYIKFAG